MLSINRVFFLSLGSVCFLVIPFFWVALVFDYRALENVMVNLSESYFVGYPIPELFGASKIDSTTSQVFRVKIFVSLFLLSYALFFIGLYSVEENSKRVKLLFRGISVPLFFVVAAFWIKFVNDDHIIIRDEKTELFYATCTCLVISIFLFAYSFRSKRRKASKFKAKTSVAKPSVIDESKSELKSNDSVNAPPQDVNEPPQIPKINESNEGNTAIEPPTENMQSEEIPGIPSIEQQSSLPTDDSDVKPDQNSAVQEVDSGDKTASDTTLEISPNVDTVSTSDTLPEINEPINSDTAEEELSENISEGKE